MLTSCYDTHHFFSHIILILHTLFLYFFLTSFSINWDKNIILAWVTIIYPSDLSANIICLPFTLKVYVLCRPSYTIFLLYCYDLPRNR
jgi:hypothetical protein